MTEAATVGVEAATLCIQVRAAFGLHLKPGAAALGVRELRAAQALAAAAADGVAPAVRAAFGLHLWWRLQPYVMEAATLCDGGWNPMGMLMGGQTQHVS